MGIVNEVKVQNWEGWREEKRREQSLKPVTGFEKLFPTMETARKVKEKSVT